MKIVNPPLAQYQFFWGIWTGIDYLVSKRTLSQSLTNATEFEEKLKIKACRTPNLIYLNLEASVPKII